MSDVIFYPDIYSGDAGINLKGAPAVCIKISQGSWYVNPSLPVMISAGVTAGAFVFGYHFLERGNGKAQAEWCYKNSHGLPIMVDAETNPSNGTGPTGTDIQDFVTEFRALGGRVHLLYLPHWYWQEMGSPDLTALGKEKLFLVSSDYEAYSDGGIGWSGYGGATPTVWQFSDSQPFGGKVVDYNAYKGTAAQFKDLVETGGPTQVWQEWVSDGHHSLDTISAYAGMGPASVLRHTINKYGEFDAVMHGYLNYLIRGQISHTQAIPPGGHLWIPL